MPKISLAGTELNYERAGEGEPLLLIQGMTANLLAWGRPFSSLLEERFDVISFDNRGMGLSSPVTEGFSIAEMAADTAALLEALEIESAHVLGISMGGMIAQELALAHPEQVRSLTLGCTYCGGPGSQLMDPADFQDMVEAMSSGNTQRVYRAMYELNLSPAFRADESRYAEFTAMTEALPASRQTIGFQLQAIMAHDTSARLPELDDPDPGHPRHRRPRARLPQRSPDRLADSRRPPRDLRGRRPHVLVGAAAALGRADPRARARARLAAATSQGRRSRRDRACRRPGRRSPAGGRSPALRLPASGQGRL